MRCISLKCVFLSHLSACYPANGITIIVWLTIVIIVFMLAVYMRKCTAENCTGRLPYDGTDDCVLNLGIFMKS